MLPVYVEGPHKSTLSRLILAHNAMHLSRYHCKHSDTALACPDGWRQRAAPTAANCGKHTELYINLYSPKYGKKGKVYPCSLPSVGPGADPGVQAVSPQVT